MTIKENIDRIIAEEYSINDKVLSLTHEISAEIESLSIEHSKTAEEIESGLKLCTFSFKKELFNQTKSLITVNNYYFKDRETFNRLYDKYSAIINEATSAYLQSNKLCFININSCTISGGLVKNIVNDNIQHEVEHCFQEINTESVLPKDNNYNIAYNILARGESADELIVNISKAFYYSYSFEQDGFVNGLYQFLDNSGKMLSWNEIENSSAMKAYKTYINALKYVFNNSKKDDVENILKYKFNIGYNVFKNRCLIAKKHFANKIGKVIAKHRKDMIEKGWRLNENITNKGIIFGFY